MILCDTNILIEFYKGDSKIVGTLQKIGLSNLAISAVTTGELYYGATPYGGRQTKANYAKSRSIFPFFNKFHWTRKFLLSSLVYWGLIV